MPIWTFSVDSANELDNKLRSEILALDLMGRGDEVYGEVIVICSDSSVRSASLIPLLESRGVNFKFP
jgi:hypothetical protein